MVHMDSRYVKWEKSMIHRVFIYVYRKKEWREREREVDRYNERWYCVTENEREQRAI